MQKIEITIKNKENVGTLTDQEIGKIQKIVTALVTSGSLTGVKRGKTVIHFDDKGDFRGIELDYWPWKSTD